mmetsp:Transcript_3700/g.8280  ORF Transcript_3700/g.8280 Transcript_3700/m.8280 type:complete len:237 (+) Transcript_3700:1729-2439(+)
MSRGTHKRFATVRSARAPWMASSFSITRSRGIGMEVGSVSVALVAPFSSTALCCNKRTTTCRSSASTVSSALAPALGMWPCDLGGSLPPRQSLRTAAWFETSLFAASRADVVVVVVDDADACAVEKPLASSSAAASALAMPAATLGLSSPPPKYRRNMDAVAVQEYSSPAILAPKAGKASMWSNQASRWGRPSRMSKFSVRGSWCLHRSSVGTMMASSPEKSGPNRKQAPSPVCCS